MAEAPKIAAAAASAAPKMVRFKIDGKELTAPAGTSIIQAAHGAGFEVPYFCYHPGLKPEGNCRMCLVEVAGGRKPVASCVTPVGEGMEVLTDSPGAKEARKGVLELMLVNHPLDCPICDKSGECILQDNTYDHGPDGSRMVELKELKPTKDLGSTIALWGNRCIVCTRCVRFCHDVAGTGELTIVNRGDHSVVDVFDDYPLENPLSLNTVDICPVGALISKDFLYEARVWELKSHDSICTGCARGCNTEIQTLRNEVKRVMPRHNAEVNGYWMCDAGRLELRHVGDKERLFRYALTAPGMPRSRDPSDAARYLAAGLRAAVDARGVGAVAGIGSGFMTLEEAHLLKAVIEASGGARLAALSRPSTADQKFPQFRISGDRNPNRAGVAAILGEGAFDKSLDEIKDAMRQGEVRAAIIFADLPEQPLDDEMVELLGGLDFAAVFLLRDDARLGERIARLPATASPEKTGTMVNEDGRLQRLRLAVTPPRQVRFEHEILQEVLIELGARERVLSADGVFRALGEAELPELAGKSHRDVGALGLRLSSIKARNAEPSGARV